MTTPDPSNPRTIDSPEYQRVLAEHQLAERLGRRAMGYRCTCGYVNESPGYLSVEDAHKAHARYSANHLPEGFKSERE